MKIRAGISFVCVRLCLTMGFLASVKIMIVVEGITFFHIISGCGVIATSQKMSESEARFKEQSHFHTSGLHEAICAGDKEKAKGILISDHSLINEVDYINRTPLILAVQQNDRSMVELLFCFGAQADTVSFPGTGNTALHYAVMKNNVEIAGLLIEHGASINQKNFVKKTPLTLALEKNRKPLIELLRQHGAEGEVVKKDPLEQFGEILLFPLELVRDIVVVALILIFGMG